MKRPRIHSETKPLTDSSADAWICLVENGRPQLPKPADPISKAFARLVRDWLKTTSFSGDFGEVAWFPTWDKIPATFVVVVGLGDRKRLSGQDAFSLGGQIARELGRQPIKTAALSSGIRTLPRRETADSWLTSFLCGWQLGSYEFSRKSEADPKAPKPVNLTLTDVDEGLKALRTLIGRADMLAGALADVRDLANRPGGDCPPAAVATKAKALAKKNGLTCQVLEATELRKQGFKAILGVGQGSSRPPNLTILKYPGRKTSLAPIVLVGKTITFDTGGISLKQPRGMEWMKYDKCGGMAVLAAMAAIGQLKPERPVIGLLACAENMPGGKAYRPGDILETYSGKTVEVLNTDAEGRLVLADALARGARYNPHAMVDLATLTGAVIVALGDACSAIMSTDEQLTRTLRDAGDATGERLWPLPLWEDYDQLLKSSIADIKNVHYDGAGTITAGAFLKAFVPEGIPWAHLDIAATAWTEKPLPHMNPGATLFGARLLVEWVLQQDA